MSRLETAARNLGTQNENYAAEESRIRDADVAADAAEAVRLEAGAAVLSQANVQPQLALQLLER